MKPGIIVRDVVIVLVAFSLGNACVDPTHDRDSPVRTQSKLDFLIGALQGTVSWNGAPVTGSDAAALYVADPTGLWSASLDGAGQYGASAVPAGAVTIELFSRYICDPLSWRGIGVPAGITTTADFDLSPAVGRVIGSVKVNGVPTDGLFSLDPSCGEAPSIGASGFSLLAPAGLYHATVQANNQSKSFTFTVVAGQITDVGAVDIQSGSVAGSLFWAGASVILPEAAGITVSAPSWSVPVDGTYHADTVAPGDHTVGVHVCGHTLTETVITVLPGATTNRDFNVTTAAGRVTGLIALNGVPAPTGRARVRMESGCYADTDQNGHFSQLLPVGNYVATVFGSNPASPPALRSFAFTVFAGLSTDVGTINAAVGSVEGTVSWAGGPLLGPNGLYVTDSTFRWFAYADTSGDYHFGDLAPGAYTLGVYGPCGGLLAQSSPTIPAGAPLTVDFDVTAALGRVTGSVGAAAGMRLSPCSFPSSHTDPLGHFALLLAVGSYSATVSYDGGGRGAFSFSVLPGQTIDLGTVDTQTGTGSIQGTVSWNGAPVNAQEGGQLSVSGNGWIAVPEAGGDYHSGNLPPGGYDVRVSACSSTLAQANRTVSAGATATADFDLTPTVGRLVGTITVNGTPVAADLDLGGELCSVHTDSVGHLDALFVPGNYQATVSSQEDDSFVGTFDFTIVAGQTTDIDQGGIGRPCSAAADCVSELCVDGVCCANACGGGDPTDCQACSVAAGAAADGTCGPRAAGNVCRAGAGDCDVAESCTGLSATCPGDLFASGTTVCRVSAGVCDVAELCTGASVACPADAFVAASTICDPATNLCEVAGVCTGAGAACPGHTTLPPTTCTSVPTGFPAVNLDGGTSVVGGMTLTFTGGVGSAGQISVVDSGIGCPPPTGFQIVPSSPPHYWNIDTTAVYTPPIRICIHYDQAWVGPECPSPADSTAECTLRLMHGTSATCGAGADWTKINVSLNTTTNIICGSTNSLSPFALAVPLPGSIPVVTVPGALVAEATKPTGAVVTYQASATDLQDGPLTPTCTPASGSTFPLGTRTVTCTATDSSGLVGSASFTVTVRDTTPPGLTVPPDITIAMCQSPNIGTATATDAIGPITITSNKPARFPLGTTVVTYTVRDASGNVTTKTQRVTAPLGGDASCCPVGSHVMRGTSNNDTINGTSGADCILGLGGQDRLIGGGGDDSISGGDGDDVIDGGGGNDRIWGGSGQDQITGGTGNDVIDGGDGDDTCHAGDGDDVVRGGQGQDRLFGESGNEQLFGDDGSDTLDGGSGNDALNGGNGGDTCIGGSGTNTFTLCETQR